MTDLPESSSFPNYSLMFAFEQNFDESIKREWMIQHWHQAFYYVGLYILVIFGGQAYMKSRTRFELRRTLAAWNVFIVAFSIIALCRTLPGLGYVLKEFGFTYSVCNRIVIEDEKVINFWIWMFTLSKVVKLADTIFIILRKQKLILLHWYHHSTVLLFAWYGYTEHISPLRWYIVMNFFAHSIMHSYFAARAMGIKMPRWAAIAITSMQISQMFAGFFVTYFAYLILQRGQYCHMSGKMTKWALFMYFSYFVLYTRYFYTHFFTHPSKLKKLD